MVASARAILGPDGRSPDGDDPEAEGPGGDASGNGRSGTRAGAERKRALVTEHFAFVWRSLIRLGLPRADAEDALQQVFLVASGRIDDIDPGAERSFLFGTCLRIASRARRTRARRRENVGEVPEAQDQAPGPEEMLDRARARAVLDEVLDAMPLEIRAVFVLHELEQLTLPEIAELTSVPLGTATSRLRRARMQFQAHVKRIEEARKFEERRPSAGSKA